MNRTTVRRSWRLIIVWMGTVTWEGLALALGLGVLLAYAMVIVGTAWLSAHVDPAFRLGVKPLTMSLASDAAGSISISATAADDPSISLPNRMILHQTTIKVKLRRPEGNPGKATLMPVLTVMANHVESSDRTNWLELTMTAFDEEGGAHEIDWFSRAPVLASSNRLAILRQEGPFSSVGEDASVPRMLTFIKHGLADAITREMGIAKVKPAMPAGRLDQEVIPDLERLLAQGTKTIGRANSPLRLIATISGPLEVLIIGVALATLMLIAFRLAWWRTCPQQAGEPTPALDDVGFTRVLPILISLPPSLGLLGTVVGMMAAVSSSDPDAVRSGISTAMGTTLLGAIPLAPLTILYLAINAIAAQPRARAAAGHNAACPATPPAEQVVEIGVHRPRSAYFPASDGSSFSARTLGERPR